VAHSWRGCLLNMKWESIRLFAFISTFSIFSILEYFFPWRKRELSRLSRWPSNLLLILVNSLTLRLLLGAGSVGMALVVTAKKWGVVHLLKLTPSLSVDIALIIFFDLAIYLQHLASHLIAPLWRLHRVHHTDPDLDVTSALRFHPLEILLSMMFKFLLIVISGASVRSVVLFEVVLSSMAIFNHSNIVIPERFESLLRKLFVTPQMHIIHHSVEKTESDTNFGFNLSIWDRLFKTYQESFDSSGVIGQQKFRLASDQKLTSLLTQPFKK
jgi:sterol desaturase/sphingolipid hydroxylase (fatty acid hydroxylase superfamily)